MLGERPRPYLDPEVLRAKFLKLSAPLHPDRVHHLSERERETATQRFSELNAAQQVLREHGRRLRLLLEWETGSKPQDLQRVSAESQDLFMEVGGFCRKLDGWLAAHKTAETSPLLKAETARERNQWLQRYEAVLAKVAVRTDSLLVELRQLDAEWMAARDHGGLCERLENLARQFSYIRRWRQQLDDRWVTFRTGT